MRRGGGGGREGARRRRRLRSASEREEAEERNEGEGEGEGVQGVALASSRRDEGKPGRLGGRRWPGRVAARAGRVPVLLAEEEGDRGGSGGGLGRTGAGPAGLRGERQVSPGGFSLSFPISVLFLYFVLCCFSLVKY